MTACAEARRAQEHGGDAAGQAGTVRAAPHSGVARRGRLAHGGQRPGSHRAARQPAQQLAGGELQGRGQARQGPPLQPQPARAGARAWASTLSGQACCRREAVRCQGEAVGVSRRSRRLAVLDECRWHHPARAPAALAGALVSNPSLGGMPPAAQRAALAAQRSSTHSPNKQASKNHWQLAVKCCGLAWRARSCPATAGRRRQPCGRR